MKKMFLLVLAVTFFYLSCKKKEKSFPPEPQIYYESALPNTINVFDTSSATIIKFQFEDGDGDIGTSQNDTLMSIFLRDSRDTSSNDATYEFPFPYIPNSIRNGKALEGTVSLNVGFQFYRMWDSLHYALLKDTMTWSVYIQDLSGNKSNVITTDTIYIEFQP